MPPSAGTCSESRAAAAPSEWAQRPVVGARAGPSADRHEAV